MLLSEPSGDEDLTSLSGAFHFVKAIAQRLYYSGNETLPSPSTYRPTVPPRTRLSNHGHRNPEVQSSAVYKGLGPPSGHRTGLGSSKTLSSIPCWRPSNSLSQIPITEEPPHLNLYV